MIEDWSLDHEIEKFIEADTGTSADVAALQQHVAASDNPKPVRPTSILICQLVLAAARNPEWIRSVRLFKGHCEVRRGVADIVPGTSIGEYTGELGRMLFSPDRLKLDFN